MEIHADNVAAVNATLSVAREQSLGFPPFKVDGREVDAVLEELTDDEVVIKGGTAEAGGFSALVRLSDFPDGLPAKETPIEARGRSLEVLLTKSNIAHGIIDVGSLAEDQD